MPQLPEEFGASLPKSPSEHVATMPQTPNDSIATLPRHPSDIVTTKPQLPNEIIGKIISLVLKSTRYEKVEDLMRLVYTFAKISTTFLFHTHHILPELVQQVEFDRASQAKMRERSTEFTTAEFVGAYLGRYVDEEEMETMGKQSFSVLWSGILRASLQPDLRIRRLNKAKARMERLEVSVVGRLGKHDKAI